MSNVIVCQSAAIPGKPIVYIADPMGKAYAVHQSYGMVDSDPPGEVRVLKRIRKADNSEVQALHGRSGNSVPLARNAQWWEVESD